MVFELTLIEKQVFVLVDPVSKAGNNNSKSFSTVSRSLLRKQIPMQDPSLRFYRDPFRLVCPVADHSYYT